MLAGLRVIFSVSDPLAATRAPATLSKGGANGNLTSGSCTCTATGGTAPYSYSWAYVSGENATINSPVSAVTTWTHNGTDEAVNGFFKCTVTDDNSDTAETPTVKVSWLHGTPP